MLKQLYVVYFSPTGGTRRAALLLAQGLASQIEEIDLSLPQTASRHFGPQDMLLFAGPVFGGRMPALFVQRLQQLQGANSPAVTVAVYGNRAYEDALLELNDCVQAQGFCPLASAALLAEHSMCRQVAAGRPNAQDAQEIAAFAGQILAKLAAANGQALPALTVPGHRPYRDWQPMPVVPQVSADCLSCGDCARLCPTQAIAQDDPQRTDAQRCILCMRCVSICPQQARSLPAQAQAQLERKLSGLPANKENEFFL